ncbi:serine threonine protein kinase [Pseudohyphozyma bogoriensis]|nr:serine threonine protein kinase [Pseudohyphozyma bogoriensis]
MPTLPPELLDYVLSLIPPSELQRTALSLINALGPHAHISHAALFRHLRLTREGQAWQTSRRFKLDEGFRQSVVTITAEAWREDPQLLINMLMTLPRVSSLSMCVGPMFAPEHLEELLEMPAWQQSIEGVWFRFNPYVLERSYYTFLKGAYFDTTALRLASWPAQSAPRLRRLAFVQDLPPTHGQVKKETPAFGLQSLEDALDEVAAVDHEPKPSRMEKNDGKMDFAQPIVFFKLFCLTPLANSPIGTQLTHLVLRLPRRNLLTALTTYPLYPLPTPFRSLQHLDLSTTHVIADPRFPLLLRLHPNLEHLVLDRCTGLIGPREEGETVALTLRWLGKCFGGIGASRGEEVSRAWKKIVKDRPTGVPAPGPPTDSTSDAATKKKRPGRSGYASMPRAKKVEEAAPRPKQIVWTSDIALLVKDVVMIPPVPKLKSLGFGLFDHDQMDKSWERTFMVGYNDALEKTAHKIEEVVHRWEVWRDTGKLVDGTKRMVTFRDALPAGSPWVDWSYEETDEPFREFMLERGLIVIGPEAAMEVLSEIRRKQFVFCMVADCSGEPGVPHVSLSNVSKEDKGVREAREKRIWEEEVIGLTTAIQLARSNKNYRIHVIARDLAEDSSSKEFSSPWAGAFWMPFNNVPRTCSWETETWDEWQKMLPLGLLRELPDTRRFEATEEGHLNHWYNAVVPRYERIPPNLCPKGTVGIKYDTVSINAPQYVIWAKKEAEKLGVTFERRGVASLDEAFAAFGGVDCVINATGLGSKWLGGVEDETCEPVRGQTVIVEADTDHASIDAHDPERIAYIIPRPGGKEVVCGGCFDVGNYSTEVDPSLARQILERCFALDPTLSRDGTVEGIKVVAHGVGLRPGRRDGPRVEAQVVSSTANVEGGRTGIVGKGKATVVHAYGFTGAGYQVSWGVAKEVEHLVSDHFGRSSKL